MKVGVILIVVCAFILNVGAYTKPTISQREAYENELFNVIFNASFVNSTADIRVGPLAHCYIKYAEDLLHIAVVGVEELRDCVRWGLQDLTHYFKVNDIHIFKKDFNRKLHNCHKRRGKRAYKKCQAQTVVEFARKIHAYPPHHDRDIEQCVDDELFEISVQLNKALAKLSWCLTWAPRPTWPTGRPTTSPSNTTPNWNTTWTPNITEPWPTQPTWSPNNTTPNWNTTWTPNVTEPWPTTPSWHTTWGPNDTTPNWSTTWSPNVTEPWPTTPSWNTTSGPNNTTPTWNTTLSPKITEPWTTTPSCNTTMHTTTTELSDTTTESNELQNI